MAGLTIKIKDTDTTIKWGVANVFVKNIKKEPANTPWLKNDASESVLSVGSMLFVSGKNLPPDSIAMLDNKIMNKSSYTIAEDEGVYLQVPKEGVFRLTVANKYGTSNAIFFEVNNSINIHVLHSKKLLNSYNDIAVWVDNVKVPLNKAGQGIAPKGLLKKGTVTAKGVSKKTGAITVLSIADIDENQKIEGVVLSPHSTAKHLIDKRFHDLGIKATTNNSSEQDVLAVGKVDSYIRNMQETPSTYNLNSFELNQEVTSAVRSIRSRRS